MSEHFMHQPHPLHEYMKEVLKGGTNPSQEMIDYLIENFDGVQK